MSDQRSRASWALLLRFPAGFSSDGGTYGKHRYVYHAQRADSLSCQNSETRKGTDLCLPHQERSPHCAHQTVVRNLALLSHVFTVGIREWEWVTSNPVRLVTKPREPRGRERYLSPDEIQRLLLACKRSRSQHLHLIVLLALSSGARQGEILITLVRCRHHTGYADISEYEKF
jgi:integrase